MEYWNIILIIDLKLKIIELEAFCERDLHASKLVLSLFRYLWCMGKKHMWQKNKVFQALSFKRPNRSGDLVLWSSEH